MNYKEFVMSLKTLKHVYLLSGAETYYIDRGTEDILSRLFKKSEDLRYPLNNTFTILSSQRDQIRRKRNADHLQGNRQ